MSLAPSRTQQRQRDALAPRANDWSGVINVASWQDKPLPEREMLPGLGMRGTVGLLNGTGGIGKSQLCQQLQTAYAINRPFLGMPTHPGLVRSLGIYCEDDADELQRRQRSICRYYGCEPRDLDGLVYAWPRVGHDNTLMRFNPRHGTGERTRFFDDVERFIETRFIQLVIIDTVADTFGGKEIDRAEVRAFVQELRKMVMAMGGFLLLTQHPSLTGLASGSGSSGSTAWHNSVRSRLYMTAPARVDEDGDEIPTDERVLKCMKSNYAAKDGKIRLVWKDGVFVPVNEAGPQSIFDAARTREMLLDAADKFVRQGLELAPDPQSKGSLIVRCRSHGDLGKLSHADLARAQQKLIDGGELVVVTVKKKDRHIGALIRPAFRRYANEQHEGNP